MSWKKWCQYLTKMWNLNFILPMRETFKLLFQNIVKQLHPKTSFKLLPQWNLMFFLCSQKGENSIISDTHSLLNISSQDFSYVVNSHVILIRKSFLTFLFYYKLQFCIHFWIALKGFPFLPNPKGFMLSFSHP